MIAALSETTAGPFLSKLRDEMLKTEAGRQILQDRPRLTTKTINLEELRKLPDNSFGRAYVDWLDWCKVTPDTRDPVSSFIFLNLNVFGKVRFIDNPELAYVMQRYRECHDFYHVVTGFPVNVSAELVVKWFEMANFGLPVAAISALFGPLRLTSAGRRRLLSTYIPWALKCGSSADCLIGVYWEKEWNAPITELKTRLGISEPPIPWRDFRKSGPWR